MPRLFPYILIFSLVSLSFAESLPLRVAQFRSELAARYVYHPQLTRDQRNVWSQAEFKSLYVSWRFDSEYALKQSLQWFEGTGDAMYFQQVLLAASLSRDPTRGETQFYSTNHWGISSGQWKPARL